MSESRPMAEEPVSIPFRNLRYSEKRQDLTLKRPNTRRAFDLSIPKDSHTCTHPEGPFLAIPRRFSMQQFASPNPPFLRSRYSTSILGLGDK